MEETAQTRPPPPAYTPQQVDGSNRPECLLCRLRASLLVWFQISSLIWCECVSVLSLRLFLLP